MSFLIDRLRALPKSFYAIGQLGLLGLPSVLFIPLLLRWVNIDVVATLLVAQVYVYYLVMLQQFGFNLMGPARLGMTVDANGRNLLDSTLRFKGALLVVNSFAWGLIVFTVFDGNLALFVFLGLLLSYVLNTNWYLQSRGDFYSGALFAGLGVFFGLVVLLAIWFSQRHGAALAGGLGWAVLVMIAPQAMVGVGSFSRAIRLASSSLADESEAWPAHEIWAQGWPLMVTQLLLLATATLGTLVVGRVGNSDVTAAYAATEKIFNLGATVMIALFAVHYPQLVLEYRKDQQTYWRQLWKINGRIALLGLGTLFLMAIAGGRLFGVYLGERLGELVAPALVPIAIWLMLIPFQNALQCHLTILGKTSQLIGVSCLMLLFELVVGGLLMIINPLYWPYGMVAAQLVAVLLLVNMYRLDRPVSKAD